MLYDFRLMGPRLVTGVGNTMGAAASFMEPRYIQEY